MFEALKTNEIIDDRYKIIENLGEGGMAIVYKAHDLITDRDVAVKMMRPETAANKVNLNRFEREARAAASLNHPNIVKVVNVGTFNGLPYMVNEFVNGQNLRQILDIRGKFTFMESCDIMFQLCSAVIYAHDHGVIHRDIKPQNIFLTNAGTIKLGDFGIATFQDSAQVTRSDVVVGTVHYIAPEVAQNSIASAKSDMYSMGITFFELITGRVPFDADSPVKVVLMQINEKFPNIKKYNPKTPDAIEAIIYRCVSKNPKDRYPTIETMQKDIERIIKNPDLLTKKRSAMYNFFHPTSAQNQERREDKKRKKALKEAAKQAKREEKRNNGR